MVPSILGLFCKEEGVWLLWIEAWRIEVVYRRVRCDEEKDRRQTRSADLSFAMKASGPDRICQMLSISVQIHCPGLLVYLMGNYQPSSIFELLICRT